MACPALALNVTLFCNTVSITQESLFHCRGGGCLSFPVLETGNEIGLSDFLISVDMTNGCILTFTELLKHCFALEKPRTECIVLWGIGKKSSLEPQGVEFQIMRLVFP